MSEIAPEFSRLVPLHQLGAGPFRQRIEATVEECEKLSRRFDLLSLERLSAEVELRRRGEQTILLEAEFEAEFEQCCAVTLEPVRGALADRFSLIYGPAADDVEEIVIGGDEPVFERLPGDAIDIGEAVAQELSLALPVFPRHPDAVLTDAVSTRQPEGPFAVLARFRKEKEC